MAPWPGSIDGDEASLKVYLGIGLRAVRYGDRLSSQEIRRTVFEKVRVRVNVYVPRLQQHRL